MQNIAKDNHPNFETLRKAIDIVGKAICSKWTYYNGRDLQGILKDFRSDLISRKPYGNKNNKIIDLLTATIRYRNEIAHFEIGSDDFTNAQREAWLLDCILLCELISADNAVAELKTINTPFQAKETKPEMPRENDLWNNFCAKVEKFRQHPESAFQAVLEQLFENLGWQSNEIITQPNVKIGKSMRAIPDIVIQYNGKNQFVVELKRPNANTSRDDEKQLFSYMRLYKVQFGILLGNTMKVFYELPNDDKDPIKVNEISFAKDNESGSEILEIIVKDKYAKEQFVSYCEKKAKEPEDEIIIDTDWKIKKSSSKSCTTRATTKITIFNELKTVKTKGGVNPHNPNPNKTGYVFSNSDKTAHGIIIRADNPEKSNFGMSILYYERHPYNGLWGTIGKKGNWLPFDELKAILSKNEKHEIEVELKSKNETRNDGENKYEPLGKELAKRNQDCVTLTFAEIENILGESLPTSAYNHLPYWYGDAEKSPPHVQKKAWQKYGYKVKTVNLERKIVTFTKLKGGN